MAAPKKRGLGKGLESLFGNVEIDSKEVVTKEDVTIDNNIKKDGSIVYIDINDIRPNENQPRRSFDNEKITELADSILEHGLIQPIVVREYEKGFEIVAGERRYRAARVAKLKTIPCIVRELTDEQNMLLAIIENVQREDLNPIDEALAIKQMIEKYGLTQEEVSKSISKSRPYITNALRLLKLPEKVSKMIAEGEITSGHGRALLVLENQTDQISLAEEIKDKDLSVRETEKIVSEEKAKKGRSAKRVIKKSADIVFIESELKTVLSTKVHIKEKGKGGKIEIEYFSPSEFERIFELLKTLK